MGSAFEPPLPVFDHRKCNGAALCTVVCPAQCLDMWNDRPWLARPRDCLSCGACVVVCPTQAVQLAPARPPVL